MNKIKTYVIRTNDGIILEICRSKAYANKRLKEQEKIQRRGDIIIEKWKK